MKYITKDYLTRQFRNYDTEVAERKYSNVQSDWDQADNTQDDYIKNKPNLAAVATTGNYEDLINKPNIPTGVVVDSALDDTSENSVQNKVIKAALDTKANISDLANKADISDLANKADISDLANKADISDLANKADVSDLDNKANVSDLANKANISDLDNKANVSDLDNKVDKHGTDSLMTEEEHNKLAGISSGAEANVIEGITLNGVAVPPNADKIVALNVVTNTVNDLTNYYLKTETYNKTEIDSLISTLAAGGFDVVSDLPTENISTNVIYLKPKTGTTNDVYDEYIYVNNTWELIGTTQIDMSNYVSTSDLTTTLNNYITNTDLTTLLADKQDTLTPGENITITGNVISAKDTTYTEATTNDAGLMSASDKVKLNDIQAGAEVNVQSDWAEADSTKDSFIKNKPNLSTVATSGSYDDLTNKPTIPESAINSISVNGTPVTPDSNKNVNITTANTTYTITQDGSDGHKFTLTGTDGYSKTITIPDSDTTYSLSDLGIGNVKNLDQSKAIKSITRDGTTFTYTCLDGTTGTFNQQDNNTWTAMVGATSSSNGTAGYVPAPPKDGYNTKFLRADGTWSAPSSGSTVSIASVGTANSTSIAQQNITINGTATPIFGSRYMEQSVYLKTDETRTITFTNSAITKNSIIEIGVSDWNLPPEDVTTVDGSCTLVMPKVKTTKEVIVRLYLR